MKEKYEIRKEYLGEGCVTFGFNDDEVDVDYFSIENNGLSAVIITGMSISELFPLRKEEIPIKFDLDILVSENIIDKKYEFENFILGNGIACSNNEYWQKFYFDNVTTGDEIYGEQGVLLLSVFEKVISNKENIEIINSIEIEDAAKLNIQVKLNDFSTIEDQYFKCIESISECFLEAQKLLNHVNEAIITKSFQIKIPNEFRTSIRQYLMFFDEFVERSKGVTIQIDIKKIDEGLEINIAETKDISISQLNQWMNEFVSLVHQNLDDLTVSFEHNVSEIKADLLIASLKNQISSMTNSLDIVRIENKFLGRESDYLKELVDKFIRKDFTIKNQFIQGENISLVEKLISNSPELNRNDKKLLDVIYENTNSDAERKELVEALKNIKSENLEPNQKEKSKSLFKKFLESGISEAAKEIVKEVFEFGTSNL